MFVFVPYPSLSVQGVSSTLKKKKKKQTRHQWWQYGRQDSVLTGGVCSPTSQ